LLSSTYYGDNTLYDVMFTLIIYFFF
jgi:hypothetical protein